MASPIKLLYGTPTAITCTINSLASEAWRQSNTVDNTSDLFVDILCQLTVGYPNDSPTGSVFVYCNPSFDGTNFDNGATGADGSFTPLTNTNWQLANALTPLQNGTVQSTSSIAWSIGFVPLKFSLLVYNGSGFALGTGCTLKYTGVKAQSG